MIPKVFEGEVWETAEGVRLKPEQMSTNHLNNTLNFIQRDERLEQFKGSAEWEFLSLPSPSGDMAELAYEQEASNLSIRLANISNKDYFEQHIKPSPLYQALDAEYKRRIGAGEQ
jgi:hypothetical protein